MREREALKEWKDQTEIMGKEEDYGKGKKEMDRFKMERPWNQGRGGQRHDGNWDGLGEDEMKEWYKEWEKCTGRK